MAALYLLFSVATTMGNFLHSPAPPQGPSTFLVPQSTDEVPSSSFSIVVVTPILTCLSLKLMLTPHGATEHYVEQRDTTQNDYLILVTYLIS